MPGLVDVIDPGRTGVLHTDPATAGPIPIGVRSALAVRRGSAMITSQPSGAGDTY
jgi:hypothetical protein